jgi:hypothetical protein
MKEEPEKPLRYGIFPAGLLYLGLLVMLGVASFGSQLVFKLVQWFVRWFDSGS